MIYTKKPPDFKNKFDIVSCFCTQDEKILLLHRQDYKPQGDTWGIPAGKVDPGETLISALQRELIEEIGLSTDKELFTHSGTAYVRYHDYDFTFHMYKTILPKTFEVRINANEHKEFQWVYPRKTQNIKLIEDLRECINKYYLNK